ncbi:MAG TPA: filamentous hemagglutinin N-terminal domain-containing protein, partial [Candidatus Paceibacterota bacterium]|nr:filamentous hemagglutinin N-terminal domain-containing protein [Candidatus Paceibacterota bacterium]
MSNPSREFHRCLFSTGVLLSVCGLNISSQANPAGGTVSQGSASFSSSGAQMTIRTSDRALINWQSFNIGVGQTTTFIQPSSTSVVWNRINDSNPSQILGNLNANGYVVLQNSAGFYIGGQAVINAHGLVMTTAPVTQDIFSGGAWDFSAPPPTASIINYGQINIGGAGSAFLIAHDIENHGTISAPGGDIGLYAGKDVLISERPDGRGLSAHVTLPEGSVDNSGRLIADGGTIALHAQVVNQGGFIQANSVREVNGQIELVASDDIHLGSDSVISAKGDSAGNSDGGEVTIKSGGNYSDDTTSKIDISGGAQRGHGGDLEISAANLGGILSQIDGHAAKGFRGGKLVIDPTDLVLTSAFLNALTPILNAGLYSIDLQADNNITLSTLWNLTDPGAAALLKLTAGNSIFFNNNSGIRAGQNWSVSLAAGPQNFSSGQADAGVAGIYLNGNSYIDALNGNITLWAANEVIVNSGAVRTRGGGSISVTTLVGDVNSGNNYRGYTFGQAAAPYYIVNAANLGGISTAAGGDVTIAAGRDVISFLPVESDSQHSDFDGGSGAFGPQSGNVSIIAGRDVQGHFVLANGNGSVVA